MIERKEGRTEQYEWDERHFVGFVEQVRNVCVLWCVYDNFLLARHFEVPLRLNPSTDLFSD